MKKPSLELPLLDTLQIASPCSADWNEMQGDERMRFCGQCQLNVFNLAEMTRGEAEKLIRERTGRVCVRMHKRTDGTVLTQDCPIGLTNIRRRIARWFVVTGTIAATILFGTLTACGAILGLTSRENTGANHGIFTRYLSKGPDLSFVLGELVPPPALLPPPMVAVPEGNDIPGE